MYFELVKEWSLYFTITIVKLNFAPMELHIIFAILLLIFRSYRALLIILNFLLLRFRFSEALDFMNFFLLIFRFSEAKKLNDILINLSLPNTLSCKLSSLLDSDQHRILDFIKEIENVLGKKAICNYMPLQKGDVPTTIANTNLLQKLTKTKPKVKFKEGVRKFVEWYLDYYKK